MTRNETTFAFVAGFLFGLIVGFVACAKTFAYRVEQAREENPLFSERYR